VSYQRPRYEVADVARILNARTLPLHSEEKKVVNALLNCRTAALGGHKDTCDSCGYEEHSYNSCRNRHCPKCGSLAKENWLKARELELLPVGYFHVVFTVPHYLNALFMWNKKQMYNILMSVVKETLLEAAANEKNLGVKAGMISILHTWGQNLDYHPHVHCIVPGGGFVGGVWRSSKERFYIHEKRLAALFRCKLLTGIKRKHSCGDLKMPEEREYLENPKQFSVFLSEAWKKEWVVYCKPPFSHPETVLKYLSRYTHRVAISNHRIKKIEDGRVYFTWKDYRMDKRKVMSLSLEEFLRRFLMHVLPFRFIKIRFSGFMANCSKNRYVQLCREQNGVVIKSEEICNTSVTDCVDIGLPDQEKSHRVCPKCLSGEMVSTWIRAFRECARASP
jgi:predicted Zn-ribbon and HTH transcriptional regulator